MILSKRVALGGVQLDEIDTSVVIRSADPGMSREDVSAVDRMGGAGQRVTARHWESLEANVTFAIDLPKKQMAARKAVYDKVIAWARRKGWLTFNWIEGRRMWVDHVVYPSGGDMWAWTDEFTLTFRSYGVPFWQDDTPTEVRSDLFTGTGTRYIDVPGTVTGVLDILFKNRSGLEIPTFTVTAGSSQIALSGIRLGGSETLTIDHGTDGLLRIHAGSRDVYGCFQGSDDLYVEPGRVGVKVSVPRAGDLLIRSVGRWIG